MKAVIISILLLILFQTNSNSNTIGSTKEPPKRILIIDSYRKSIDWSQIWVDGLCRELHQRFPDAEIHTNPLNADVVTSSSKLSLNLRSALWIISSSDNSQLSESLKTASIFQTEITPDVLVLVGEEAFQSILYFTRSYQNWANIPIVLCGVHEHISETKWIPQTYCDYNKMVPIENKRLIKEEALLETLKQNKIDYTKFESTHIVRTNGIDSIYWITPMNITGVKKKDNIDKNIQIIRQLHPDLSELIFVDRKYYNSDYVWHRIEQLSNSLLQGVITSRIIDNTLNSDSIYSEMLKPHPGRVYLTNSWKIEGMYSRRFDNQVDSLFTNQSTVPIYSLTQQRMADNYTVGGYYPDMGESIRKSARIVDRILKGEKASEISFDTISAYGAVFNESALERYNLLTASRSINQSTYINPPSPFFDRHKKLILYTLISIIALIGFAYNMLRNRRFCRLMLAESERFKRLYDKIQTVYKYAEIDFAFYDKRGRCVIKVIDGKRDTDNNSRESLLTNNILESGLFLGEQIEKLRNTNQTLHKEIQIGDSAYEIMIKSVNFKQHQHHYMAVVVDLTQMINARREKELYEQMFNYISDFSQLGIATYDLESHQRSTTDYWYKNLNEPLVRDFIPSYWSVADTDRESLHNHFSSLLDNASDKPLKKDIRVIDSDNNAHWVQENIFVRTVNNKRQIVEINLNVDNQKESEDRLRKANELADISNQETVAFIENISHEVRTPLNAIVGFSSIFNTAEPTEKQEFSNIINTNKRLLNDIIDNTIHLSMIDAGSIEFKREPIIIAALLDSVKQTSMCQLEDKPIQIIIKFNDESEQSLTSDPYYLRLILCNLLSNAIKFTGSGEIVLGCEPSSDPQHIEFYVSDTGCGIDSSQHETIFDRFNKIDNYKQGTGLGLSLCKSIVEHIGGSISLTSTLGQGTTFRIKLKV